MGISEGLSNTKPSHAKKVLNHFEKNYPNTFQTKITKWASQHLTSDQASILLVGAGMRRSIDERFGINFVGALSLSQEAEMAARHNTPDAPSDRNNLDEWIKRSAKYFLDNPKLKKEYARKTKKLGLDEANRWKFWKIKDNAITKQLDFQNDINYAEWLLQRHNDGTRRLRFSP